jgi:HK97 family phage major capsid protein
MSREVVELRQKRAGIVVQARELLKAAEGEGRDLSAEERERYDGMWGEIESLGKRADRLERQAAVETDLARSTGRAGGGEEPAGEQEPEKRGRASTQYRAAFERYLRHGSRVGLEERDLQVDVDAKGGYLVPDEFVADMLKTVDAEVLIRQWATVFQIPQADSLGVPTLASDMSDPEWTVELSTDGEDDSLRFGKRALRPHPLAKRIVVSKTLLRKAPQVEQIVRDRMAYRFAVTMERAFLVGSGVGQPLGVFTASTDGIPTARDISTGNTTTAMTFAGLTAAKFALKQAYWGRAKWLFNSLGVAALLNVVDGDGRFLWRESVRAGEPDTLLGLPVYMSEFVPSTFTTGLYVGILGDFSQYWIADALDMDIQRLDELYALTNQTGFIGRMESDGMPVMPEAFVRIKLA